MPRQFDRRKDRFQAAGDRAERQMEFYLNRDLRDVPDLHRIHGLRLVDPDRPEHDGRPGVAQIDHLLVHPRGAFIIESKSGRLTVRSDGSGGETWVRSFGDQKRGIPSPIRQAERQAEMLRAFLQAHRAALLAPMPVGLRTLSKIVNGTAQRGFRHMPIQIIVAISDEGIFECEKGWAAPSKPFATYVTKADQVSKKIAQELARHHEAGLLSKNSGEYGIWRMSSEETARVAAFLREHDTPAGRTPPEAAPSVEPSLAAPSDLADPPRPVCRSCGGASLSARWGRYGYYWVCDDCGANTPMPTECRCGAVGRGGKPVRIRKSGSRYDRVCDECGAEELVWMEL